MTESPDPYPFPKDKDELIRDFTVAGRLKEIRDQIDLRQSLAPKWWETIVGALQFAAALGLLASLIQHPALQADPLARLITFWGALTLLSLVLGFEFLILKLFHLRRANELTLRSLQQLDQRLTALEHAAHPAAPAGASHSSQAQP